jgi:Ser/Thr protein kinase RdoA (MazF antagonist)
MIRVPSTIIAEIERRFGPDLRWTAVPGASQARVWKVDAPVGPLAVKVGALAPLDREHVALQRLAESDLIVPRVRMFLPGDTSALVTDWIEGSPADADAPDVQRAAGRYLADLHRIGDDSDSMPWPDALRRRRDGWLRRARAREAADWLDGVEAAFDDEAMLRIATVLGPRVWCHRDYEARNWRIEAGTGSFRVIDFGQARPDGWLLDFVKLAESCWRDDAALREAFLEGYGRSLSENEAQALDDLGLLHGLQTYAWALEHADDSLRALGESILLRRLG